jgi:hypothetical protein
VVGEEIDVDRKRKKINGPQRRMMGEAEIEEAPAPRDIAADRGVHEAGEQRHTAYVKDAWPLINPRADAGLEYFHDGADHVVDENDFGLVEGFKLEQKHAGLNSERRQKQKIITRQRDARWVPQVSSNQQRHHRATEQASPGLFDAKTNELVGKGRRAATRRPPAEPRLAGDEAPQRRPLGGCTCGCPNGGKIVQGLA